MPPPLLQLKDIAVTLGGAPLLDGAELSIAPGERVALVGRNGSGKSTLLRIAAGEAAPDRGTRFQQPTARLAFLAQEPDMSGHATVLDYVLAGLPEHEDGYAARAMMADLGLDPEADPKTLSGGEARRAALTRVLSAEPDILLLDEPTNHLDLIAIEWLESHLMASRSALALVSHDRRLMADLTNATVWVDRGATHRLDRGFSAFEAWRDAKLEEEEAERHKLDRKIVAEEHWMRYGVSARRKRNMRRVGELADMRRDRREARKSVGLATMVAQEAKASGALVIEAEAIGKAYDDTPIVKNFSTRIMRGDRIGVIGANGAGKTTLINLLTGALAPDTGEVRIGTNVTMARMDQKRDALPPTTTLVDALTGGGSDYVSINGERRHVVGYMKDFLFGPEQARTPIEKLSGGERGRLMLARALSLTSNLMVLDEPTNDLDVETLDLLQELLGEYKGTILIVSHDRDFLDRVATSVIVSEGAGVWREYAGGYSDMVAQRGYGLAGPSAAPAPKAEAKPRGGAQKAEPQAKKKLAFHEKRALDLLPQRMEALRSEIDALEQKLADQNFAARAPAAFEAATNRYGALRADLDKAEDEWLALEILREGIEGQG
ncbi:ATP-binding cassette subfamily F protein uup [Roseiarcus fermentans]|uniref:ATP-binding cassette subfamily F protein uup n=1 Tax=Roseiarcus fermentans TaxID=1473586 RepID=A0A366F3L4_9HYPH|nr:ATP-binding cassette domain-containing protein [Roseiarcus fermentans]RBP09184.1 ATP-binding cassette subfamily F protein uup [Roseiarcus fermentans]